jgi:hypothetical protein
MLAVASSGASHLGDAPNAKRPVPKKLAKKLAQIRANLGLSQTEMVKALNYKATPLYPAQISQFEAAEGNRRYWSY